MKKNKNYDSTVYQSLAMILQFGLNMLVPILMMTVLGIWLDRKFGTSFWVVICFFAGSVSGGQSCYRMAKRIFTTPDRDRKRVTEEVQQEVSTKKAERKDDQSR